MSTGCDVNFSLARQSSIRLSPGTVLVDPVSELEGPSPKLKEDILFNNMPFAPELRTHTQKVKTLYKEAMRLVEGYYVGRTLVRYQQVILRDRFDQNRCVEDPKDQRRLLWLGQHELFLKQHPCPLGKFPRYVGIAGGGAADRSIEPPDWVMDYWHPLEKAQYPCYFQTRERRKVEYIDKWYKGEMY